MPGIVAGGVVYLSGVVASGPAGGIVAPGDLATQARQAVEHLRAFLGGAGCGPDDVVKITIYLCDAGRYGEAVAPAVAEFLGDHRPAMTVVGVTRLVHPDALVEVDATAVQPR
jgi:enamine deaminase RidA (YjgF/YER057c/UK114 family)